MARSGSGEGGIELVKASMEATLTIAPLPRATIPGSAARASEVAASTLIATIASIVSASTSSKRP